MSSNWLLRPWRTLSAAGLLLGTLFFAASLTPTLIPRTFLTQGLLSGGSFAVGYGLGTLARWLWAYLELPFPGERAGRFVKAACAVACAVAAVAVLLQATEWQNSIRVLMELEPVASANPLETGLVALATFACVFALAQLLRLIFRAVETRVGRFVPRRVANVVGFIVVAALFWGVANGVIFRAALHSADVSFQTFDALLEPERDQPTDPARTGSPASLLAWDELGRAGREFITSGPTGEEIAALTGRDALEPVRVYVGLRSAETPEARAALALEELKRVGGFERGTLILLTPTGTGWIDPSAMNSVEYLHDGDIASVALQYSYLASPLSLLVEPGYGADAARALFRAIYGHWTSLPRASRPKLYLHGLSLGSMNSALSTDFFEVMGDPFHGALWSGPPFASRLWRSFTEGRDPDSPAWLPRVRDGSFVRFMNQDGSNIPEGTPWGAMRIVYLQYASDPITFFDHRDLYREPDWMQPPRGPDVSPELRWYPVVTMLQLGIDALMANTAPMGYGHIFAPAHYIDAWLEVTDVRDWSPADIERLKQHLAAQPR